MSIPFIEDNDQTQARHEHLEALRVLVGNVYPNKFERSRVVDSGREDTITAVVKEFRGYEPQKVEGERPASEAIELANQELKKITVRLAGRIASPPRVMGKAAFAHLSDGVQRLQVYVKRAEVMGVRNDASAEDVDGWELFNLLDHGDFVGVEGYLFITKTGELSIHVQKLQFLAKALLPLPDKMHGIQDPEIRQRQRYADLIAGSLKIEREEGELSPREVFERRSGIIRQMRRILDDHGYVEVETPMLTSKATGAAARPFKTRHNALDIDLYARIAPELYLKRLLVGGFEKVYELNRNFRNEGIDRTHNPEFTMLEFYWAYADVKQMMDFCEKMIRDTVFKVLGQYHVQYGTKPPAYVIGQTVGQQIYPAPIGAPYTVDVDFAEPFDRLSMRQAIKKYWIDDAKNNHLDDLKLRMQDFSLSWLDEPKKVQLLFSFISQRDNYREQAATVLRDDDQITEKEWEDYDELDAEKEELVNFQSWQLAVAEWSNQNREPNAEEYAASIIYLFETLAEPYIKQPTFITDFPKAVSPLSKASPANPAIAERFELFIAGMECANGFSELNDPKEQYDRFNDQMTQRERGDEEAMIMDEDYIRALSYGMPPAAGIGIGIDRFVMLLTNQPSIRDVILFPHMRPERVHQFSWMKWMVDELSTSNDWPILSEDQRAERLVERFKAWVSEADSPPSRKQLLGNTEEEMLRTARRALRVFGD
ncbi:MAG: lysine--tRNA ligase [Pyrinomonadaceae bacterium]|nr:lysine--tRNA ligase [Pyrinomonadaceae bacterium]